MELAEAIRRRRMVRRFTAEPVDPAVVDRALAAAVRAPSAGFSQGWEFLVLDTSADVDAFWRTGSDDGPPDGAGAAPAGSAWLRSMRTAPVLVVVLASKDAYLDRYAQHDKGWADRAEGRWPVPYWHVDAGMAALLMLLTAVDADLGACFFGLEPARVPAFRARFGVPAGHEVTGVVALGHPAPGGPAGSPSRRPRRPLDEVVHRGRW